MKHVVTIEKIISSGKGLARPNTGKVVMSGGVLPGERVKVREVKQHQGYIEAELVEIISPSPARRQPICSIYLDCGGCDLQHCNYTTQLQIKMEIIKEGLARAGVACPDDSVTVPLPSPENLEYRYRIRMKVNSNGQIGFNRKKTNTVVPVMNCAVATAKINEVISLLQSKTLLKDFVGICKEIEILHSPANDAITLLLHVRDNNKADQRLLAIFRNYSAISQVAYKTGSRSSAVTSLQPIKQHFVLANKQQTNYSLSWTGGCFSQVNARQNEQLVRLVCRLAGDVQSTSILDLYCGMGNFSIPLALHGAAVTGIELNRESICRAKHNAESAGVICSFFAADVHNSLQQLANDNQQVDCILLDPPRKGIGKAARLLPKLQPEQIIYISCDPATLARDIAILCDRGYSLAKLIPVDMFPQTHHIESVALLEKN